MMPYEPRLGDHFTGAPYLGPRPRPYFVTGIRSHHCPDGEKCAGMFYFMADFSLGPGIGVGWWMGIN